MHRILKILILSSIFYNLAAGSLGPIYALFVQQIGGDIVTAGTAISIYTGAVGILILVFGSIEDRLNKKKVFILGRAINVIGIVGYLFVTSPLHLYIVQAILGIAIAMMNPTFEALYSRGLRKGHEAFEWSRWEGTINIVLAIAATSGSLIAAILGFQALFMFMAAFAMVGFVVATFTTKQNIWSEMRGIVRKRKALHI